MTDVPPQNMVNPEIPHFWRTEVLGLAIVVFRPQWLVYSLPELPGRREWRPVVVWLPEGTDKQDNADRDHEHPHDVATVGFSLEKDVGQYCRYYNFYVD